MKQLRNIKQRNAMQCKTPSQSDMTMKDPASFPCSTKFPISARNKRWPLLTFITTVVVFLQEQSSVSLISSQFKFFVGVFPLKTSFAPPLISPNV